MDGSQGEFVELLSHGGGEFVALSHRKEGRMPQMNKSESIILLTLRFTLPTYLPTYFS